MMPLTCSRCLSIVPESKDGNESTTCPVCGSSLFSNSSRSLRIQETEAFDRFKLLERVGSGRFGNVWRAFDSRLKREVALKIPKYVGMEDADRKSFMREAQSVARLSHPGVLTIFEVGEHHGCVYIVAELLPNGTFQNYLRQHPPTIHEAADQTLQIAEALAHAHRRQVIHRDLKPGNILMTENGRLKVADFGLAKTIADQDAKETEMTKEGHIFGTLPYMSPEQARGAVSLVDHRTDIYALGVIFYELLTKQRPFDTSNVSFHNDLQSLAPVAPRQLNPSVPGELEAICLKCLAKQPNQRYTTADEIAQALRKWLTENPAPASSSKPTQFVETMIRRSGDPETPITPDPEGKFVFPGPLVDSKVSTVDIPRLSGRGAWRQRLSGLRFSRRWVLLLGLVVAACLGITGYQFLGEMLTRVRITVVDVTGKQIDAQIVLWAINPDDGNPDPKRRYPIDEAPPYESPVDLDLPPGEYLVVASISDKQFAEVFRRVPKNALTMPRQQRHLNWEYLNENGQSIAALKPIEILDVDPRSMAPFQGSDSMTVGLEGETTIPIHQRRIPAFLLDTHETTFADLEKAGIEWSKLASLGERAIAGEKPDPDSPVTGLFWDDAVYIAERMGKRLPTEFEYEFAATQGGKSRFPWGNDTDVVKDWPVGHIGISPYDILPDSVPPVMGLFSNVLEWTSSGSGVYPPYFRRLPLPEPASPDRRIVRGGPYEIAEGKQLTNRDWERRGARDRNAVDIDDTLLLGLGLRTARSQKPRLTVADMEQVIE